MDFNDEVVVVVVKNSGWFGGVLLLNRLRRLSFDGIVVYWEMKAMANEFWWWYEYRYIHVYARKREGATTAFIKLRLRGCEDVCR
mmetsp:Transcript_12279/g.14450  ORF Transcript_12279/g.14450 Transcript_12279/m.14450 type:complete len:85 (-) Transcript_12279:86-340(-)